MKNLVALKVLKTFSNSFKTSVRFLSAVKTEEIVFHSPYKSLSVPEENVTDFVLSKFATHWQGNIYVHTKGCLGICTFRQ